MTSLPLSKASPVIDLISHNLYVQQLASWFWFFDFSDFITTAIIQHTIAAKSDKPNAYGAKLTVSTQLNLLAWEFYLQDYHDSQVASFLRYGWPIDYEADNLPTSTIKNHPSAEEYKDHVQNFIATELRYCAVAGPFEHNPLPGPLVCSPLQTVPKRDSTTRRVVMDLSFPPQASVNSGIQQGTYLNEQYKLRLPGIDRLCSFVSVESRATMFNIQKGSETSIQAITYRSSRLSFTGFLFWRSILFWSPLPLRVALQRSHMSKDDFRCHSYFSSIWIYSWCLSGKLLEGRNSSESRWCLWYASTSI